MRTRSILALPVCACVACGASDGAVPSDDGGGGQATGGGGMVATGGTGGRGMSGAAGAGGVVPSDSGPSDTVTPEGLFPLAVGNHWTFQMTSTGANPPCAPGTVDVTITGTAQMGGRTAFTESNTCFAGTGYYSVNAGQVEAYGGSQWAVTLAAPVEDGHSWPWNGATTFTWKRVGTVTVPAGTFSECWARVPSGNTLETATFCNHVGSVSYVASDWKQELLDYSLL